jgi:hypothetical protein
MSDGWDDTDEAPNIGRGHGEGSKATRFQSGGPSGNPRGRPPKVRGGDALDVAAALRRRLDRKIKVREGGVTKTIARIDAMAEMLLNSFQTAEPRDKIRIMTLLMSPTINVPDNRSRDIPLQSIEDFVDGLVEQVAAAEAESE